MQLYSVKLRGYGKVLSMWSILITKRSFNISDRGVSHIEKNLRRAEPNETSAPRSIAHITDEIRRVCARVPIKYRICTRHSVCIHGLQHIFGHVHHLRSLACVPHSRIPRRHLRSAFEKHWGHTLRNLSFLRFLRTLMVCLSVLRLLPRPARTRGKSVCSNPSAFGEQSQRCAHYLLLEWLSTLSRFVSIGAVFSYVGTSSLACMSGMYEELKCCDYCTPLCNCIWKLLTYMHLRFWFPSYGNALNKECTEHFLGRV
jgi:hypothetical protein